MQNQAGVSPSQSDRGHVLFEQPLWFCAALVIGLCLRLYFSIFTQGTYDLEIWHDHAVRLNAVGLINYYHENPEANHPPFMSEVSIGLLHLANATGISFDILFRLLFTLIDAGTTTLLWLLLKSSGRRLLIVTAYWLNPLAILMSSYHGNTDSGVAFFALLAVWYLSRNHLLAGAIVAGAGLWIKLPVIWAFPGLLLLTSGMRARLTFLAIAGVAALSTYLPSFLIDAPIVLKNVFGYHGLILTTSTGVPIWGLVRALLEPALPAQWDQPLQGLFGRLMMNGWKIAAGLAFLLVWVKRKQQSPGEVCATIAVTYALLCGWSESWTFQYFAWSLPFWFFLPSWFPLLATVLAGGYIYSLYWFLSGSPFLLGTWDFIGRPQWPFVVLAFRDLAIAFFWGSANWFVAAAARSSMMASNSSKVH